MLLELANRRLRQVAPSVEGVGSGALALLAVLMFLGSASCRHRSSQVVTPPAPAGPISLLAGTTLAFRTAQTIDSSSDSPGLTYAAVVSRDANDSNGQTLLTSGSPVTLVLLHPKSAPFELALASITLNGNSYLVRNEPEAPDVRGIGAHLGKFLGGVPSTLRPPSSQQNSAESNQIMMSQERIRVPVGSLITFRLDRPVWLIGSP